MAYVAVRGGLSARREAEKLTAFYRLQGESDPVTIRQIREQMRLAVDQIMGEGSLYDPDLAALALKQAEGDSSEASMLLRAFRSTLPRSSYSIAADTSSMRIIRRISAVLKDIPGGHYLGPTTDYSHRLLQFGLMYESADETKAFVQAVEAEADDRPDAGEGPYFPKVIELLRKNGYLAGSERSAEDQTNETNSIDDLTRQPLLFPASRAMRLQCLARGETGALTAFAYANTRKYGSSHPLLGELRVGYVPLVVPHPLHADEWITLGEVLVTEAEVLAPYEDVSRKGKPLYMVGYGFCFGHNEMKAIAMGTLDIALSVDSASGKSADEEEILMAIDGTDASGFITHWKLPHYVDFQAGLAVKQAIKQEDAQDD
jgi:alpha-D-ribose 1-methylphosphonate 5-triphosphate synthase subunit PhnI